MRAPAIGIALFVIVAYATQDKYPGKARHDIRDYVPPEEDIITGEDLKHFKENDGSGLAASDTPDTPGPDDVIISDNKL